MNISQFKEYTGVAINESGSKFTYLDLLNEIQAISEELQNKIVESDVVCIHSDYTFKSIALLLALSQTYCIIVPIVPVSEVEFHKKIDVAGVKKIVYFDSQGTLRVVDSQIQTSIHAQYLAIIEKKHCGLVLFSSGTTGNPKIMVHDFSSLIQSIRPPKKPKSLKFLLFLLFDHIGGLNTLLNCLNNGSEVVLPQNRNPEYILDLIQKERIQILPTSPTFINLMLMTDNFDKYDLSSLRLITYGTERMPAALLERIKTKISHVKFIQTFGTSETGIMKTQSKSSESLFFRINDPDYKFKILEGQLFLKSNNQVKGYINSDNTQFDEEGWFATGDLVETDEGGFIKIIGRINNVINIGGQKVLPKEIEDILLSIPEILDATVYGEPSAITGQMVCAEVVVPKTTDPVLLKKLIVNKCRESLEKYKVPSKIIFKDSITISQRFKKQNINP